MAQIEVTLSDQNYSEIENLIDQGEFLNWEQASEELLSMGLSSYNVEEEASEAIGEDALTEAMTDEQDPALHDDPNDDEPPL